MSDPMSDCCWCEECESGAICRWEWGEPRLTTDQAESQDRTDDTWGHHHQLSALPDNTCHSDTDWEQGEQSAHTWRCWLILIEEQNTMQDNALTDTADMMEKVGSGEGVMRWNMVARGERGETVSWWIIENLQTCDRDKTVSREAVSDRAKKFKKYSSLSFV